MNVMHDRHEFAIHIPDLHVIIKGSRIGSAIQLTNPDIIHRLYAVLRAQVGHEYVVFDRVTWARILITTLAKNKPVVAELISREDNPILLPMITVLLPVLKKESLESALYSLTEIGVNRIQLVHTQKVHRPFKDDADFQRAQRIIIAAAEQSKHFSYPQLLKPKDLATVLADPSLHGQFKVVCDPSGAAMSAIVEKSAHHQTNGLVITLGPEGGFTAQELELLQNHQFIACRLTPTVLRACQAAAVVSGIFRSLLPR